MRILLAVTDFYTQEHAKKAVEALGAEAVVASSLWEAMLVLDRMHAHNPEPLDGALIDVNMRPVERPEVRLEHPLAESWRGPGPVPEEVYELDRRNLRELVEMRKDSRKEWLYDEEAPVGLNVALLAEKYGLPFRLFFRQGNREKWEWASWIANRADWSPREVRVMHAEYDLKSMVRELVSSAKR